MSLEPYEKQRSLPLTPTLSVSRRRARLTLPLPLGEGRGEGQNLADHTRSCVKNNRCEFAINLLSSEVFYTSRKIATHQRDKYLSRKESMA